jgi:hypothetical protein
MKAAARRHIAPLDALRTAPCPVRDGDVGTAAESLRQGFIASRATRLRRDNGEIVDYYQFVMADYFATMGIPIVAGRDFDRADITSPERVTIVNETLANKLWKGRNPIGQRVRPNLSGSMGSSSNPWHTVIGVARDVKEAGVDRAAGFELYMFTEQPGPSVEGRNALGWRRLRRR